ncbi:MAG TPA: non-ribosomal peptide synthetase, partial [Candidatus Dormibacteraeota bacterium]
ERPRAVALESGGAELTYGQLIEQADAVAAALRARGVRGESRVGLLAERDVELVVGLLGILRAGAAFVPLDPGLPAERLEHMARDAGIAHLVIGQRRLRGLLPSAPDELMVADLAGAGDAPAPPPAAAGDGLAYVMYTSGSTGRPKGVAVTRRGLAAYVRWASRMYGPGGSVVHSSIGFDLTLTALLVPLVRGERVELLPDDDGIDALGDALAGARYGLVKLTPAHLEVLNRRADAAALRGRAGTLVVGGEQLWGRTVGPWISAGVEVFNEYGPTEMVVGCVVHRAGEAAAGAVPIGRPAPGVRARVLTDDLRPVGEGMVGELCVGGPQVARGYWGRPAETAERFLPDPWGRPGDRIYRTGDLVRWGRDGELTYVGRRDRQVKVRGHRVEPGEIEAVMREHEAVAEVAVAARGPVLVGYVVWCGPDRSVELRGWLRRRLPRPMLPGAIVGVDELPLTSSGKVDQEALAGLRQPAGGGGAKPATDEERALAAIWEDLLGLDEVGVEDDFFDLGGHSLLAVQLFERIRAELGVDLPPRVIFEAPAIVDLAREVAAARREAVPAGQPASDAMV